MILDESPTPIVSLQIRATLLERGDDVPLERISSALTYLHQREKIDRIEIKDAGQYQPRVKYCVRDRKCIPAGWGWMPHTI